MEPEIEFAVYDKDKYKGLGNDYNTCGIVDGTKDIGCICKDDHQCNVKIKYWIEKAAAVKGTT